MGEDSNSFRGIVMAPVGRRLLMLEFGFDTDGAPMINIDLPSDLTSREKGIITSMLQATLTDILPIRFAGANKGTSPLLEKMLKRGKITTTEMVIPIAVPKG